MTRKADLTFMCEICDDLGDSDVEIEMWATPGHPGTREDPPEGPEVTDLRGCRHADAWLEGSLNEVEQKLMDRSIDQAFQDAPGPDYD